MNLNDRMTNAIARGNSV